MTTTARLTSPALKRLSSGRLANLKIAINLLLVLLLSYQLAQLTWRFTAPDEAVTISRVASTTTSRESDSGVTTTAHRIAALHLFGTTSSAPTAPTATIEAPPTRLNLTLRGLLASAIPEQARAIIAADGKERLYATGDALPGGASVKEIHTDHVILERAGRLETLGLPKERAMASTKPAPATRDNNKPQLIDQRNNQAMSAIVRDYRERLSSDLATLGQRVQVAPVNKDGQFQGFRINRIDGRERKLRQLGLRRGDTVTAINGITLDSPYRGMEVLQSLGSASELNVEIVRNGAAKQFLFKAE